MATLANYRNPPIVEAALEFVFDSDLSEDAFQQMKSALGALYTGPSKNATRVERDGTGSTAVLLTSENRRDYIGLGIDVAMLTVHTTAPYPGWGNITSRSEAGLKLYAEAYRPRGIKRVSIRYIDRILVPIRPQTQLSHYFTCAPSFPQGMAPMMAAFQVALQSTDEQGTSTLLTICSDDHEDADGDNGPVLYDIIVEKNFEQPVGIGEWMSVADGLHTRQREIFEASITEKTRRLFQ